MSYRNFYLPTRFTCRGLLLYLITHSDTHTHTHSIGLLWTSDQPDAESSPWHYTALTTDRFQCRRRDSNPQCQQVSDRRSTLLTARPRDRLCMKSVWSRYNVPSWRTELRTWAITCKEVMLFCHAGLVFCSYCLLQVFLSPAAKIFTQY